MPFGPEFDEVLAAIRRAAHACHLHCWRADEVSRAGFVRQLILEDIEAADVVVADLTGRNANVFYETAVAHLKKDPHQVVLLAQRDDDVPFDLRPLRYLKYSNNPNGRRRLTQQLAEFLKQGLQGPSGRLYENIDGKTQRTRRIVADCEALSRLGTSEAASLIIRTEGGLSALSISDDEIKEASGEELAYRRLLIEERNSLTMLITQGATYKAILAPRIDPLYAKISTRHRPTGHYLRLRYDHLITTLTQFGEDLPPERCQLTILPPGYVRSLLILGGRVSYEGIKAAATGGYDLSIRVTDTAQIAARIRAFDGLFRDAESYTVERYGHRSHRTPRAVRAAFVRGLQECYDMFRAQYPPPRRTPGGKK
jgi:hypothetical protein